MEEMMEEQKCSTASKTLHDQLKNDNRLDSVIVFKPHEGSFCFRVKFLNPIGEVHGISISYPMDVNKNKVEPPKIIETALIDEEEDICYNDDLGYDDVRRFDSVNNIVEEILRISSANHTC